MLILPSDLLTPVIEPIDAIEHFSDKSPHCDQRLRATIEKRSELRTNRPATDLFRPQMSAFISMLLCPISPALTYSNLTVMHKHVAPLISMAALSETLL